jgi:hypothetical protein
MTPVLVSVDKAGDLKFGRKKCRLHKKDEVVKVAKKYGVPNAEKKTVNKLCSYIKARAKNSMNNVPLAKLYPEAAKKRFPDFFEVSEKVRRLREMRNEKDKKRAAAKKRAEKKDLNKKVATNFMKGMVTKRIVTPTRATIRAVMPMPKPQKKAMPLTKDVARKRIMAMKGLNGRNKFSLVNRLSLNQHSPRKVVRLARELARLR